MQSAWTTGHAAGRTRERRGRKRSKDDNGRVKVEGSISGDEEGGRGEGGGKKRHDSICRMRHS